jgi:YD repeat-containing protein
LIVITDITNPLNQKQEFKYDSADNLIKRFDALENLVASLKYDSLNNPTEITDALQNTSTLKYDALNRLTQTVDSKDRVI